MRRLRPSRRRDGTAASRAGATANRIGRASVPARVRLGSACSTGCSAEGSLACSPDGTRQSGAQSGTPEPTSPLPGHGASKNHFRSSVPAAPGSVPTVPATVPKAPPAADAPPAPDDANDGAPDAVDEAAETGSDVTNR